MNKTLFQIKLKKPNASQGVMTHFQLSLHNSQTWAVGRKVPGFLQVFQETA